MCFLGEGEGGREGEGEGKKGSEGVEILKERELCGRIDNVHVHCILLIPVCVCRARRFRFLSNRKRYGFNGFHFLYLFVYKYFLDTSFIFLSCTLLDDQYVSPPGRGCGHGLWDVLCCSTVHFHHKYHVYINY